MWLLMRRYHSYFKKLLKKWQLREDSNFQGEIQCCTISDFQFLGGLPTMHHLFLCHRPRDWGLRLPIPPPNYIADKGLEPSINSL